MTDIQRYQEYSYGVEETVIGEFVKYDDHDAIVSALREQVQKLTEERDSATLQFDYMQDQINFHSEKAKENNLHLSEIYAAIGYSDARCEQTGDSPFDCIREIGAKAVDEVVIFLSGFTSDECGDSAYIGTVNIAAKLRAGEQSND